MTPDLNKIYQGDCLDVMKAWPDNFIDTIITDPPYGISFMGKSWDHGVPGIPFWSEMIRICKPGATLLSFGGTRTFHRLTVAIEDAGWEIRDCITWLYGSGFPKSLDISKAIDKAKGAERVVTRTGQTKAAEYAGKFDQAGSNERERRDLPSSDLAREWSGWGTALKPAWEPIIVAMKPLDGTFAQNAEKWGVAGINVDGGRIDSKEPVQSSAGKGAPFGPGAYPLGEGRLYQNKGRWPANLILDEEAAAMLDEQSGGLHLRGNKQETTLGGGMYGHDTFKGIGLSESGYSGASRFFYVAKADRAERNEGCEGLPTQAVNDGRTTAIDNPFQRGDTLRTNTHPTVKPLDLMKYLCVLTRTPTGGIVLDPFCGSGTTLWAAECHNRPWIGIEKEASYVEIANARLVRERSQIKLAL